MDRARVLVVDDKVSVLAVLASMLRDVYEVTTASDPIAAMSLLTPGRFDLVLTDVCMPTASGFDLLAAVKRNAADTTVVLMTGFASIPDAVKAIRQGAFDYVAKPLEAAEVSLVVARALEHRERGGASGPAWTSPVELDFRDVIIAARDSASREYLLALMEQFRGNVTRAAAKAGMTRENLHRLLRKYGVRSESFKQPAGEQGA